MMSIKSPQPPAAPPPAPTRSPAAPSASAHPTHTPQPLRQDRSNSCARRASIATITACAPKLAPISPISSGRAIAAELIETLSAPASKTAAASSADRIPPPTVNGTNKFAAVRFTVSSSVPRPSCVAVISSNTISSAPAAACRCASSAGSPASTISTNCTPFTTRPARTSRQAMILLVSTNTSSTDPIARENSSKPATPSPPTSPDGTARPSHCPRSTAAVNSPP